jgi:N6-L-threonylcarbamoyladenine synthase
MINSGDLNFSFSGLKTAVLYAVRDAEKSMGKSDTANNTPGIELSDEFKKGLAREFEESITETLDTKLRKAIEESGAQSVIIGGGVSANSMLRAQFQKTAEEYGIQLYLPSQHISGDNALMIALAGVLNGSGAPKEIRAHGTKRLGI